MSSVLQIPRHISAKGLAPFLEQLGRHADADSLDLDFSNLARVTPAGLVALTAVVAYRSRLHLPTAFSNFESCQIAGYLRRMALPRSCGLSRDEMVAARNPKGRFIPIEEIDYPVDRLGAAFAEIIAPGGEDYEHPNAGLYATAWYLITEMANNVRQHSRGRGFIAAQTTLGDGQIRIAIGDGGCGIPASLKEAGFSWAQELPDEDIIGRALEARISSKGSPTNEGVGLTLSSRLIDAMGGHLLIASGSGLHIRLSGGAPKVTPFPPGTRFPGTLITMTFPRSAAADFDQMFSKLKDIEIPLRPSCSKVSFEP